VLAATPAGPQRAFASTLVFAAPGGTSGGCASATSPCDLQSAIDGAVSAAGDNTVVLAPGTYSGSFQVPAGAASSLTLEGPTSAPGATVDGGSSGSSLDVAASAPPTTVERLSLVGGQAGASTGGNGGGLYDAGAAVTVLDSAIASNQAVDGGGVYVASGTVKIEGSTIFGNTATADGGGVYVASASSMTLEGSTIAKNVEPTGGAAVRSLTTSTVLAADVLAENAIASCGGVADGGNDFADDPSCPGARSVSDAALFATGTPSLAAVGGPTETVATATTGDPAYDSVPVTTTSLAVTGPDYCSLTDQRGVPRSQPAGAGSCSAGAYQFAAPVITSVSPARGPSGTSVTLTGSGLTLTTSVTVSGHAVPFTVSGDSSVVLTVLDDVATGAGKISVQNADSALYPSAVATASFTVLADLSILTAGLPSTEVGVAYAYHLAVTGGAGQYSWSVGPNGLPAGFSLSNGGALTGSARHAGQQTVSVSVTDRDKVSATANLSMQVDPGPNITTSRLPPGRVGSPYSVRLGVSGGTPPYAWSIGGGPIPGGFLLSSQGTFGGRPGTSGTTRVSVQVTDSAGSSTTRTLSVTVRPLPPPPEGYAVATASGRLFGFGSAKSLRSPAVPGGAGRSVAVASTPTGTGYWVLTSTGRVYGFGGARSFGSVGRSHLQGRPVGIAALPTGKGYWVLTSTGRVYGFGRARALGTPKQRRIKGRAAAIAALPTGTGYWVVTAAGRVYGFGRAHDYGSVKGDRPPGPITGIASAPTGTGYWLVASTGRVYGFGAAPRLGNLRRQTAAQAVTGIAPAPVGSGYWLVTSAERIEAFGSARSLGTPPPSAGRASGIAGVG